MKITKLIIVVLLLPMLGFSQETISEKTKEMTPYEGYFDFYWEAVEGKIWLVIDKIDTEFLYVNSLSAGVGSNDIGLDRGQLGSTRIVKFEKVGPKILMVQPNYDYRAVSDNELERKAVEDAFAKSVLWGFTIAASEEGQYLVDATDFFMQDAHDVSGTLQQRGQGNYRVDRSRSAMYLPRTKNFPKNSEFEATITLVGNAKDYNIRSVTPTSSVVTVRQHHSFIELPDDNYQPRVFDPRSGYFAISFYDYATPISEPLEKKYIVRHRLEKKDPTAAVSEAVEPIVYYLDAGTPEPIRSALLDGAKWWNQAFEAAGYKDAFQVKMMPDDADPMDVRYNVINWVHRSTRGWSYGASVVDPRTGEIIKGHVSLGSLRVRQDYLIAQGLLSPFKNNTDAETKLMQEMALARLRQLSAHEIGHTIGLSHNFAASVNDRASVMDYPHPFIGIDDEGNLDFENAYDDKIGDWDKRTVLYGYQDFPEGTDEATALRQILEENTKLGFQYITDSDARPQGGAHAHAHLWDNGGSAVDELNRILKVRKAALGRFGENSIREGMPMATLEDVLVPLYLAHRYQTEAAVKLVGGMHYTYKIKGDNQSNFSYVDAKDQKNAMKSVIGTLDPEVLALPEHIINLIPPRPQGYGRGRENFISKTGVAFDPISAAESSANHTIGLLLNSQRANRMIQQHTLNNKLPSLEDLIDELIKQTWKQTKGGGYSLGNEINKNNSLLVLRHLMELSQNTRASDQARAVALLKIIELEDWLEGKDQGGPSHLKAHYTLALREIDQFLDDPEEMKLPQPVRMPDGSPIGCE